MKELFRNSLIRKYRYQKQGILDTMVELHMIELNKVLMGQTIDDWIRFFNVKTQEELDMLRMRMCLTGV